MKCQLFFVFSGFILGLSTIRKPGGVTGYAVGGIVLITGFLFAMVTFLGVVVLLKVSTRDITHYSSMEFIPIMSSWRGFFFGWGSCRGS